MKKLVEIIKEHEKYVNYDNVHDSFKKIDDFMLKHKEVIDMKEYEELYIDIEEDMCPFLTKEKAEYYTSHIINTDKTKGPHFTMEQISNALVAKHIEKETENYGFYDLYTQINLIYSDLGPVLSFDSDKIISASLAYLNDIDFPAKGMISYTKWYCKCKEELWRENEEEEEDEEEEEY